MNPRWLVSGLALAAIGATCGGDGSTFSSGVDKGSQLGSLSAGDAQKVCTSLNEWMQSNFAPDIKEVTCRFTGVTAAALAGNDKSRQEMLCKSAYDQCMMSSSNNPIQPASCEKPPSDCTATVGELESCVNDMVPLLEKVIGAIPTCQQLASGATATPPTGLEEPASCKTFNSKCDDLDLPSLPGGD
jgi:hypothetical protein